eukprot:CAMPEP_0183727754 /NCGR_PEP_ID=MMETSP0737-20130205/26326_1 /TAXON_ID=385413 /ORGANISM="Thalassiosira miniscula, Strain CCMP1093" /LENGTH=132 /DNA_ID=CAMNT_0025959471 /DNA_START=62 /DNA_END=457 /DNA_ORIENTATION=+
MKTESSDIYDGVVPVPIAVAYPVQQTTVSPEGSHPHPAKTKPLTFEAELCKTLNISWADARELLAYAKGTLGILPGDKHAENSRRPDIILTAIEVDRAHPKKRVVHKKKKKPQLSPEERRREENIKEFAVKW